MKFRREGIFIDVEGAGIEEKGKEKKETVMLKYHTQAVWFEVAVKMTYIP